MASRTRKPPRSFLRNNGLSLVLAVLVVACLAGQVTTGFLAYNHELVARGAARIDFAEYLVSGHFVSAVFENWESEFLQMGLYVWLTAVLYQRGSAESRPLTPEPERGEDTPPSKRPAPMRRTGIVRWLYEHSLAIALLALFVGSFALHAYGSWRLQGVEARLAGQAAPTLAHYLVDPELWFESFQNWQSEFLAVFALVVLSIRLRQKDSPQSKHVNAPHEQTGT